MDTIFYVIMISAISGIVSTGLGGVIGALFKRDSNKIVSLLLEFAGGVMLAVVCFNLIPEALDTGTDKLIIIAGIVAGYVLIYLLNYLIDKNTNDEIEHIDESHPKTADDLDELIHSNHLLVHKEKHKAGKAKKYELLIAGIVMAAALALHNLPEGMVIGASYVGSTTIFSAMGFLISIILALHNIPEGMAISVPLIAGGMSKPKAILISALSGIPTVIGAVIGYLLGVMNPLWLALSLSFASGAMLYVVFGELFPEAILMWKNKVSAIFILIGFILGMLII